MLDFATGDHLSSLVMMTILSETAELEKACGFVPLSVRYKAADAALAVVQEWRDA